MLDIFKKNVLQFLHSFLQRFMSNTPLKDLAIAHALKNNWQEAISVNKSILSESPNDIDTLNRLAFSLLQNGEKDQAESIYKKVISIDPTNPIAIKNLKRMNNIHKNSGENHAPEVIHMRSDFFIEEAGKTKTLELKNLSDFKSISYLQSGDPVLLVIKRSKIFVLTLDKKYVGMLPDSVGLRLAKMMGGGNEYQACIKAISEKNVTVFIKEVKCVKKFQDQPSFVSLSSKN